MFIASGCRRISRAVLVVGTYLEQLVFTFTLTMEERIAISMRVLGPQLYCGPRRDVAPEISWSLRQQIPCVVPQMSQEVVRDKALPVVKVTTAAIRARPGSEDYDRDFLEDLPKTRLIAAPRMPIAK